MKQITSILAFTDFSSEGDNAVRRAALLAHEHGAVLKVVHVLATRGRKPWRHGLEPSTGIDVQAVQKRAALSDVALQITRRYDVAVTVEVLVDKPVEAFVEALRHADLVVVGRRSRLFADRPEGRSLSRALSTSGRPVLTVTASVGAPYRRGVVSVDLAGSSDAAVEVAAALLGESRLHLFHAINTHDIAVLRNLDVPEHVVRNHRQRQKDGAVARMRRKAAQLGLIGARMRYAAEHGHPVWSALRQAAAVDADLIVAGTQAQSVLSRFLLGSVSRQLVAKSACDVLVVPEAREDVPAPSSRSRQAEAGMAGGWWRHMHRGTA